jgi:hypothetical protein
MSNPSSEKSRWYFPPDMAVLLGSNIILPIAFFTSWFCNHLFSAGRTGDSTLIWFALALATIGTLLLFAARLPLYKQRRFFVFGPRELDEKHRQLYWRAYKFIGASVGLLLLLLLMLR